MATSFLSVQSQVTDKLLSSMLVAESMSSHYNQDGEITESPAGALGIAQFMPSTWQWLKDTNRIPQNYCITNEHHQKSAQKIYMRYLYTANYGIVDNKTVLALASYNAGINRVKSLINLHGKEWREYLPNETKDYLYKLNL